MTSLVLSTEKILNSVTAGQHLSHSAWPPRHVSSKAILLSKGERGTGRNHYKTRMPRSHCSIFCWFVFSKETCQQSLQLLQELQFLSHFPWTTAQRRNSSVEPLGIASRWSRSVILDLTALISLMNPLVVSILNLVLCCLISLWLLNTLL